MECIKEPVYFDLRPYMSSSLSGEPGSYDPFELASDPILSCVFCFASPADMPMLPDHPIYAALTQEPVPLNQLRVKDD